MSEAATEQTTSPGADGPAVAIPERPAGAPQPVLKTAVWPGPRDPKTGRTPHEPGDDEELIPPEVAEELQLEPGARITVKQKPLTHMDDARLLREALQREAGDGEPDEDTPLEPFTFLQVLIDRTVMDSNINIHKSRDREYRRVHVRNMAADDTVWWLYVWLGAAGIMRRMRRSESLMEVKKKPRRSSTARPGTR